jgi:Matrixin
MLMTNDVPAAARRGTGVLRRWGPAMAAAVLLGAFVAPRPALAVMDILQADNNSHTYCFTSGFTTDTAVADTAMDVLVEDTEFTVSFSGTCSGSRTASLVDVWWSEMVLIASNRGEEQCRVQKGGSSDPFLLPYCETADVRMNFPLIDSVGTANDALDREKTAVHEVGHSVGLAHHTHVCAMRTGELGGTNQALRRFHADDIAMIDDNY